jgi:predicted GNAT family acetyltransferase
MTDVVDNSQLSRFELEEQGQLAFADYRRLGGQLVIPHVEAAPGLRGTGAAGRLMEGVLAAARSEGLKVVPQCSYAAAYIRRHAEHQDLVG